MRELAEKFGKSLDNDAFEETKETLSPDCKYIIGNKTLTGPHEIGNSYEQNMLEGRKKLDKLEWGTSRIETLSHAEYFVHFTDYLTHKGIRHTFRCKQKITIRNGKIVLIEHIEDPEEQRRLDAFYHKVGLK